MMDLLRDSALAARSFAADQGRRSVGRQGWYRAAAALDHPERRVRHAAATLAHLDPKLQFNAERVIELLAEAVGQWDMTTVLVIEPDFRQRNAARSELQSAGILAFTAGDGFEGRLRLNEAPVKDAIIIAGDLTLALRDEHKGCDHRCR